MLCPLIKWLKGNTNNNANFVFCQSMDYNIAFYNYSDKDQVIVISVKS